MKSYFEISDQLFERLEALKFESLDHKNLAEIAVNEISSSLYQLREMVQSRGFNTEQEEILFFKFIKPKLVSHLTYYQFLYEFESNRSTYSDKKLRNFLKERKNSLFNKVTKYPEFLQYFRDNCNHMDLHFFTRSIKESKPKTLIIHNLLDPGFSTTHDNQVSLILAYDLISQNTAHFVPKDSNIDFENSGLTFTDSKVALTELAYSLYFAGCVNHGKADVREISFYLSKIFNIEIGDSYRTYLDIKSRKGSKTKFLEKLVLMMNQAIYEDDAL